jgi:hypothetical protein
MRTDVCGCFASGKTPLVSHETLWEYGKDVTLSRAQETFMSIVVVLRENNF